MSDGREKTHRSSRRLGETGLAPTRRSVLVSGLMAGSLLVLGHRSAGAAFAVPRVPPPPVRFDVIRAGDVIGTHEVDFTAADDALVVNTRIDIQVHILRVKVFEFRHKSTETWGAGRLQKFDSETLDDDSRFSVNGRATADGFQITHRKGSELAPADIMAGSYWTPEIARQTLLLDPQRGRLKEQQLLSKDTVSVPIGRASVEATRYTLTGLTNGWIAYDERGRWLSAQLKKKGSDILYRLRV
jgi:Domain of unknown function (DUF6134)